MLPLFSEAPLVVGYQAQAQAQAQAAQAELVPILASPIPRARSELQHRSAKQDMMMAT